MVMTKQTNHRSSGPLSSPTMTTTMAVTKEPTMPDQTPPQADPPDPALLRVATRALTRGCYALHRLIQDSATPEAERVKLRAIHSTIASAVLALYDPARVAERRREAMATRGVVGREWTNAEVSDVFQMILLVLDDDASAEAPQRP